VRPVEAVPAVFMIALSVAIAFGTADLRHWDGTTPGARFFASWLAGAALLLGVVMLIAQRRGTDGGSLDLPDRSGALRVGLILAGMAALAVAAPVIGMVPAVALLMAFLLLVVLRQPLVPSLVTTAIVAIGIEAIFVRWLGVPLPTSFVF
jgi:putative tricarboxylic transport membrane protein